MKTTIACAVLCGLLWTMSGVCAAQSPSGADQETAQRNAGAILLDFFFLRPLGFAGTVIGTAIYVVSLPVSLPTKSADRVAKYLVVTPAQYTFVRPLGEVDGLTAEANP